MRGRRFYSEEEKKKLEEENREARRGCFFAIGFFFILSLYGAALKHNNFLIPAIILFAFIGISCIMRFIANKNE